MADDVSDGARIAAANLVGLMVQLRGERMTHATGKAPAWSEERQMRQIATWYDWALGVVQQRVHTYLD